MTRLQAPEQASVDIPIDPAQAQAEQPNEVVRREADQAYLDSVIDGSERGEKRTHRRDLRGLREG